MARAGQSLSNGPALLRSVITTALMLGVGVMGAVDEIVFHQLLQWHNFYVDADEYWRVFSDGLFHIFTASLLFLGAMRLWVYRGRMSQVMGHRAFMAGILIGAGGFQVFDGIVNHKLLQLHPVREDVDNIIFYDAGWILAGAALLVAGWLVWTNRSTESGRVQG